MIKNEIIAGQRFGRLVTKEHFVKDHMSWWVCQCDCGKTHTTRANALNRGMVRSCGCLRKKSKPWKWKHGLTNHPLYRVYHAMKDRCYRETDKEYPNYGARGINICKEWLSNFESFYSWAIQNGYKHGLSIDRIDVNKGYEPSNCRWANGTQQAQNKRNNRLLTFHNETHCVTEWSRILNIPAGTLKSRIRRGWTIEQALAKNME